MAPFSPTGAVFNGSVHWGFAALLFLNLQELQGAKLLSGWVPTGGYVNSLKLALDI